MLCTSHVGGGVFSVLSAPPCCQHICTTTVVLARSYCNFFLLKTAVLVYRQFTN